MTADEFVKALSEIHAGGETPFRVRPREKAPLPRENPIEDLLVRYDCARLAIGRVSFLAAPRPHSHGVVVAFFESEHVVLLPDQSLVLFEHERFGEKLMDIAKDAAHFFRALLRFAAMWQTRDKWLAKLDDAARECADEAGGETFDDFYVGLVSFLEYGADDLPTHSASPEAG